MYIDPIDTNVARQAKSLCTEIATYSSSREQIYQSLNEPNSMNAFKSAYPLKIALYALYTTPIGHPTELAIMAQATHPLRPPHRSFLHFTQNIP